MGKCVGGIGSSLGSEYWHLAGYYRHPCVKAEEVGEGNGTC